MEADGEGYKLRVEYQYSAMFNSVKHQNNKKSYIFFKLLFVLL